MRQQELDQRLTARESEILDFLATGLNSRQIAVSLCISHYTVVSQHRKNICRKLGLHSTAQLVAYAASRNGVNHQRAFVRKAGGE